MRTSSKKMFGLSLLLAAGLSLSGCCAWEGCPLNFLKEKKGLELTVLHTNDTHSHVAGIDKCGNAAFSVEKSIGGRGRVASAVRAIKAEKDNVIFSGVLAPPMSETGVTETRLLTIGIPYIFSISSPTETRRSALRVILS